MFTIKLGAGFGLLAASAIAYQINTAVVDAPPFSQIEPGKIRLCVAGFPGSPPTAHSHYLADKIAQSHPDQFETWYYWSYFAYYKFLSEKFDKVCFKSIGAKHLIGHDTSPFVWLERSAEDDGKKVECIGGNDHFCEWVKENFAKESELVNFANEKPAFSTMFHSSKAPATSK